MDPYSSPYLVNLENTPHNLITHSLLGTLSPEPKILSKSYGSFHLLFNSPTLRNTREKSDPRQACCPDIRSGRLPAERSYHTSQIPMTMAYVWLKGYWYRYLGDLG